MSVPAHSSRSIPQSIYDSTTAPETATKPQERYIKIGRFSFESSNYEAPIQWMVLDARQDVAILMTRYAIELYPTQSGGDPYTVWEKSTVRKWLNGTFFQTAFSTREQKAICPCAVRPSVLNPQPNYRPAKIEDRITLLSQEELQKYLPQTERRLAPPTPYAVYRGLKEYPAPGQTTCCRWALRTYDAQDGSLCLVNADGSLKRTGNRPMVMGVRPVIAVLRKKDSSKKQSQYGEQALGAASCIGLDELEFIGEVGSATVETVSKGIASGGEGLGLVGSLIAGGIEAVGSIFKSGP